MATFTTDPTVVESRWRTLSAAERARASVLLQDAAEILTATVPRIVERLADGTLSADRVAQVQGAMVLRVMRNPDGHRQESISVDDATRSWTIDSAVSSGALYASADEISRLSPPALTEFAGSVQTSRFGL